MNTLTERTRLEIQRYDLQKSIASITLQINAMAKHCISLAAQKQIENLKREKSDLTAKLSAVEKQIRSFSLVPAIARERL